jgi:5-hydroxyisourate hydrolase
MGRLTTHVLDTSKGCPAAALKICLFELKDAARVLIAQDVTNHDGRCAAPLLDQSAFRTGIFELEFHAGDYFRQAGIDQKSGPFLDIVPVRFIIADANAHYHVPLLLSPYGYSTYRGS